VLKDLSSCPLKSCSQPSHSITNNPSNTQNIIRLYGTKNSATCRQQPATRSHPKPAETKPLLLILCLLTPWSRVLPEKLKRPTLLKKFPAFYGTQRFITAFTKAHFNIIIPPTQNNKTQSVDWLGYRLDVRCRGSNLGRSKRLLTFSNASRPTLEHTLTVINENRCLFSWGQAGQRVKLTPHVHLEPRLRTSEVIPPWRSQEKCTYCLSGSLKH
jgi:hypothetical protein